MSTYHSFYNGCEPDIKSLIDVKRFELCPPGYENVPSMDEYYIASLSPDGSDNVFEKAHVDGPFAFMKSFKLLRCIYVIQENDKVMTTICHEGISKVLQTGEHSMFDYNKDVHYITYLPFIKDNRDRSVLKLHFVRKDKYYKIFAFMNSTWNSFARYIFIKSKTPHTVFEHLLANIINQTTKTYSTFFTKDD